MPELPEVEGFRRYTEEHLVGRTVVRGRALDDWMLKDVSPRTFGSRMSGRVVTAAVRKGKVLFVFTDPPEPASPVLVLHFGMTGLPVAVPDREPVHRWDRLVLDLEDGTSFRYRNQRRLGSIRMIGRADVNDLSWGLGPDALEAPRGWYEDTLPRRRGPVKAVLLDQGFLAGMGNMYADEALFDARIRPGRPAHTLAAAEVAQLHRSVRKVLRRAMKDPDMASTPNLPLMKVRSEASRLRRGDGAVAVGCPR
ncbi:MAG TPA: DNA-formamidopyrimidine glycosylase family protein, partial [Actinomycetota bacterium]|nr:DNA-formamidopyrimidine glycosylase family protein [Actinomycetota bacterium]